MACKRETMNFACIKKSLVIFIFLLNNIWNLFFNQNGFKCSVRIPFILNPFRCALLSIKIFFSRVINLLLTWLTWDRTLRMSALGSIFFQHGLLAWLIRCMYPTLSVFKGLLLKFLPIHNKCLMSNKKHISSQMNCIVFCCIVSG